MPLIECPDCQHQVSDVAPTCPGCGKPMAATTVEQTDKRWKRHRLIAGLIGWPSLVIAVFLAAAKSNIAWVFGLLFFAMGIYEGTVRVMAWWKHG